MHRFLASRNILTASFRSINIPRDVAFDQSPSFYILPEVPPQLTATELFSVSSLSDLREIAPEDAFNGFSKILLDFQLAIAKLSETVSKRNSVVNLETFVTPLEEIFYPVEHALQLVQAIPSYNTDFTWSLILRRLNQKAKKVYKDCFCLDPAIYQALLTAKAKCEGASTSQLEMLNAMIAICWMEGAELNPACQLQIGRVHDMDSSSKLYDLQKQLAHEQDTFQAMVLASSTVAGPQLAHARLTGRMPNPSDLLVMSAITGSNQFPVAESDLAPSAPSWLPGVFGGYQNGGHIAEMKVNLASDAVVRCLLRHCSTRQVRRLVWESWVKRATVQEFGSSAGQHAGNDNRIQAIRHLRTNIAKHLGCPDWLSVVWKGSPYQVSPVSPNTLVHEVLEPLRQQLKPLGKVEFGILSEWASSNLELRGSKLECWDIDYAVEQYNFAALSQSPVPRTIGQSEIARLDSLAGGKTDSSAASPVLSGLLTCLHHLAGLFQLCLVPVGLSDSFARVVSPEEPLPEAVQPRTYRVVDARDGSLLGELALDLFNRPGRPAMFGAAVPITFTSRTHLAVDGVDLRPELGKHSSILLMANLDPSLATETSGGIALQDLLSVAFGFGSCLQRIVPRENSHSVGFTTTPVTDMSQIVGDVCSVLLLSSLTGALKANTENAPIREETNKRYSTPGVASLLPVGCISALPLLHQLYTARFALSLWSQADDTSHWEALNETHWAGHLPYARHANDRWPCSSMDLFGSESTSAFLGLQYHPVWRQVVLHDVLAALTEAGWSSSPVGGHTGKPTAAVQKVLSRFRDTLMASADRLPPAELFREFRGRDPVPDFLVKACQSHSNSAMPISHQ